MLNNLNLNMDIKGTIVRAHACVYVREFVSGYTGLCVHVILHELFADSGTFQVTHRYCYAKTCIVQAGI